MTVQYGHLKEVHAMLKSHNGDADLYLSFEPEIQTKEIKDWARPTSDSFYIRSNSRLDSDIIDLPEKRLQECFKDRDVPPEEMKNEECGLIFGVKGIT